jgi:membrane protease YdiL (CAAX protease family)
VLNRLLVPVPKKDGAPIPATLLILAAALLARSWLQSTLLQHGSPPYLAADLSYLIVPPLLALLLTPILYSRLSLLRALFRVDALSLRLVLIAITIGLLLRIAWWSKLLAGVALGIYADNGIAQVLRPTLAFECPAASAMLLGLAVTVVLVPIVEETINRGLLQSSLSHLGPLLAIPAAAFIFAISHRSTSWTFVFGAGLVLGVLFWKTQTLWLSLATHASFNGLALFDWRCLQGQWNPPVTLLPLWNVAIPGLVTLALAIAGITFLLHKKIPGSTRLPGNESVTERLRPAR